MLVTQRHRDISGFSLVEAIVATAILAGALVSLAGLLALATRSNAAARSSTLAVILAEQKLQQLKALAWHTDPSGLPVSDVATNVAAFAASGACAAAPAGASVGLSVSPAGTLEANTDGYVDYVSDRGCGLGGGPVAPAGTVWVRRWSIAPLPENHDTLVLQVLVIRRHDRRAGNPTRATRRGPEDARLTAIRTRKRS